MAEKNDNDNRFSRDDCIANDTTDGLRAADDDLDGAETYYQSDEHVLHENSSIPIESGLKKEENPFSFKRFLNQDTTNQKHHNLLRRTHSPESGLSENQNFHLIGVNNNSSVLNTNEMASVLPDFVQDHLVIEQCYLNGGSPTTINIDNLNLHNLPDLNLEHGHLGFNSVSDCQRTGVNHHHHHHHQLPSPIEANNLPDFAQSRQYRGSNDLDNCCNNKTLPDFTVNTSDRVSPGNDEFTCVNSRDNSTKRKTMQGSRSGGGASDNSTPPSRSGMRMSSSPSVPLDLPSYEGADGAASLEQPIPFDLTVAAEDRNGAYRGIPSTETVSKSLPDFLSDGPIQNDRLGENLQLGNLVSSLQENDMMSPSQSASDRFDRNGYQRECDMLRRQLSEKNRRIHILESEIENLQSRGRRDSSSLEYTLLQTERNFKEALKRASNAETALMKARQENNRLKAEIASLRSNADVQVPGSSHGAGASAPVTSPNNTVQRQQQKSQQIAEELRLAANAAETSLRTLLTGVENLRLIAASVENMRRTHDKTDDIEEFDYGETASGPAL